MVSGGPCPLRRTCFEYPAGLDPAWVRRVLEFAYAANGLSLLMPYAEPLFIRAVRKAMPEPDDDLRARSEDFIRQEVGHYREHERYDEICGLTIPVSCVSSGG